MGRTLKFQGPDGEALGPKVELSKLDKLLAKLPSETADKIRSGSESELRAMQATASEQEQTALANIEANEDAQAAKQSYRDLTETDRADAKEARQIQKAVHMTRIERGKA